MSVVITNISEEKGKEYGKGKQYYVLGINHLKFVEFEHEFQDGLAECLRAAADAFEKLEESGELKIYEKEQLEHLELLAKIDRDSYNTFKS